MQVFHGMADTDVHITRCHDTMYWYRLLQLSRESRHRTRNHRLRPRFRSSAHRGKLTSFFVLQDAWVTFCFLFGLRNDKQWRFNFAILNAKHYSLQNVKKNGYFKFLSLLKRFLKVDWVLCIQINTCYQLCSAVVIMFSVTTMPFLFEFVESILVANDWIILIMILEGSLGAQGLPQLLIIN